MELAAWRSFWVMGKGGVMHGTTQNPHSLVPILDLAQVASDRNPAGTNLAKKRNSLASIIEVMNNC